MKNIIGVTEEGTKEAPALSKSIVDLESIEEQTYQKMSLILLFYITILVLSLHAIIYGRNI